MRRAMQPVSERELLAFHSHRPYPDYVVEYKADDHGVLDGRVVTLDYGYADEADVTTHRTYFQGFKSWM
jgi:hypothetical protein